MLENLNHLTVEELGELHRHVALTMEKKEKQQVQRKQIEELAAQLGFSVELKPLTPALAVDFAVDDRKQLFREFWEEAMPTINAAHPLASNRTAPSEYWFGVSMGITGITVNLLTSGSFAQAEVNINRGKKIDNKLAFDFLAARRGRIEEIYGGPLSWERRDEKVTSKVRTEQFSCNVYDRAQWPNIADFLAAQAARLTAAFSEAIGELRAS